VTNSPRRILKKLSEASSNEQTKTQVNTGSEDEMIELKGKKVIVLGERDGIQGPAIAACIKSAGAEPLLVQTQCFV
jgi:betaine reductase